MHGLLEAINGGGGGGGEKCRRLSSAEKQLSGAQSEGNKGGGEVFLFFVSSSCFLISSLGRRRLLAFFFFSSSPHGWLAPEGRRTAEGGKEGGNEVCSFASAWLRRRRKMHTWALGRGNTRFKNSCTFGPEIYTKYAQSMTPVPTYAEETRQPPGKRPLLTFHGQSIFFTLECTYLPTYGTTHWLVLEETR